MRLTESQRAAIKATVASAIDPDSRVWLIGSRADDGYKEQPILQPLAAEIAWTKNTLILNRCQSPL